MHLYASRLFKPKAIIKRGSNLPCTIRPVGVIRRLRRSKSAPITTTSSRSFREALSRKYCVQNNAVKRCLARRHNEEDIELRYFGMHDDETSRSGCGEGIASGATLERLHHIGEMLMAIIDGV